LYGLKAGILGLILYTFNPDIISNSVLVMTDIAVAGFMFISLYFFWRYMKKEKTSHLIVMGIFFGLAISTKSTGIFLLPIFFIMALIYKKRFWDIILTLTKVSLVGIFIFSLANIGEIHPIWNTSDPFYANEANKDFRTLERLDKLVGGLTGNQFLQETIKFSLTKIPVPGPHSIEGYLTQFAHSQGGHSQYFMESFNQHGVWYYYFVSYLIKTPISLMILFLASLVFFTKIRKSIKDELMILIPGLFFVLAFSFVVKLNLGLRHTLLFLLLMILFTTKIVNLKIKKQYLVNIFLSVMIIWYILASFLIYPYYLAYFNEFVGPENGHKYLVDSSLDFGQELKHLNDYVKENNISEIKLRYSGFERPGFNYSDLTCEPQTGLIAISATALEGNLWHSGILIPNRSCFEWLRNLKPVDNLGYSIFIYNVTEKDIIFYKP
jgi:4-amino-4-deoxy-L-arabinose transferase-like glycosyltransferase